MVQRILRLREVRRSIGEVSRSTIYNRIAAGLFPKPIRLGPRLSGWLEGEVQSINAAYVRGATAEEIREIVTNLTAQRSHAA